VLGAAKGRIYAQDELACRFSQALFPRTTNRYGCVILHSYHSYTEAGLPQAQVLLWMAGEQLWTVFENVVLAVYHCRYDWQDRQVKDIRGGALPDTLCVPARIPHPLTLQDARVVYRARFPRHRAPFRSPTQQLLLFEMVHAR
jgi:hypothetical protein